VQDAVPAVAPAARVQVAAGVPVELDVKVTVPVGVVGLDDVSVRVAVQLVAVLTVTELGVHCTLVLVVCNRTVLTAKVKLPELVL
jgi:hypothetical protein